MSGILTGWRHAFFLAAMRTRRNQNSIKSIHLTANLGELAFAKKRAYAVPKLKANTAAPHTPNHNNCARDPHPFASNSTAFSIIAKNSPEKHQSPLIFYFCGSLRAGVTLAVSESQNSCPRLH